MANIVDNMVTIIGDLDTLSKLSKFVESEDYDFDLRKISKYPSTRIIDNEPRVEFSEEVYFVNFQSAWQAPLEDLKLLSKLFPEITINLEYDYFDGGIKGFAKFFNGEQLEFREEEFDFFEDED